MKEFFEFAGEHPAVLILLLAFVAVIVLISALLGIEVSYRNKKISVSTKRGREKVAKLQKVNFLSTGLAIGYYYNFLHKFCNNRDVTLSIGNEKFKYDCRDIKIYIVLPRQISDAHLQYAQQYNAGYKEEGKFAEEIKGFYRIKSKGDKSIEVIDFPTTIKVLKYYIEDLKGNFDKELLLKSELENFKVELKRLVHANHIEARINLFFVDHHGNSF